MGVHWTCATPRQHPEIERYNPTEETIKWDKLYNEAEELLKVNSNLFDDSIRNKVIRKILKETYPNLPEGYETNNLPLAAELNQHCKEFVYWSSTDVILGEELLKMLDDPTQKRFLLKVNH